MLEAIRFKDCQSLSDCTIPFAAGLNVIVAENNTGKSVLYKVLKLAGRSDYYSREERKDLIRRGAEEAQITFKFSDGTFALMKVTPARALYAFLESAKSGIAWYPDPPTAMIEGLGLLVSNTEAFIANIVDMDQGLLLVNPRLQSNYELIKMIATCESLDELREKLEKHVYEFREKSIRAADAVNFVERQIAEQEYYDVESLERKRSVLGLARDWLFNCCTVYESVGLVGSVSSRYRDFNGLLMAVDFLDVVRGIASFVSKCGVGRRCFWESELEAMLVAENLAGCVQRVQARCPLPTGCETMLRTEEALLAVRAGLGRVGVEEPADWDWLLDLLVLLERVRECLGKVAVGGAPVSEVLADGLSWSESLLKAVKTFSAALEAAGKASNSVAVWEEKFVGSGESIECPVWGEVIFDGSSCAVREVSGG